MPLADSRIPHTLYKSVPKSIWQEIDTDNSVALQYKLDYLEVLSTLIGIEVKEGVRKLPHFEHYKSEIQHLNTRRLDDNKNRYSRGENRASLRRYYYRIEYEEYR